MTDRRLIVMRHAKSSWSSAVSTDHARPLNDRGSRDAPRVGAHLVELGWQPQFVLSSDAQRTRGTAEGLATAWTDDVHVDFQRSLYHAGYDELVAQAGVVPNDAWTLLVLGHNPGWEGVVRSLTGESIVMKTATAALLTGNGHDWDEAMRQRHQWQLVDVVCPREIGDA